MSRLGTVATSFARSSAYFVTANSSASLTTMMRVTPYPYPPPFYTYSSNSS